MIRGAAARALAAAAWVCRQRGGYQTARRCLILAADLVTDWDGQTASRTAILVWNNLAVVHKEIGELDAAVRWYGRALAALARANADPSALAAVCHNLAGLAFLRQHYEEAESYGRRALAVRQADEQTSRTDVAREEAALGPSLAARGQVSEARSLLQGALTVFKDTLGADDVEVAFVLTELSALDIQEGHLREAEATLRSALAIKERALGAAHPSLVATLYNLAAVSLDSRQRDASVAYIERALAILRARTAADYPWRSPCESLLRHALVSDEGAQPA